MAGQNRLSRISDKSFEETATTEPKLVAFRISTPAPYRQLSLLALTVSLNTLLWSSIICAVIAFIQIGTTSKDHTNVLPGILTLSSVRSFANYLDPCLIQARRS